MKNLSAWIAAYLILIANPLSAETFTNTNDDGRLYPEKKNPTQSGLGMRPT
jgi:hypothetical protein